jgi:hypothetical protein
VANDRINNRRRQEYLRQQMGLDDAAANASCAMWIEAGFDAFNALLAEDPERGDVCFGEAPTLADVALIPELESPGRVKVDMRRWHRLDAIDKPCSEIDAFRRAAPACQPDSVCGPLTFERPLSWRSKVWRGSAAPVRGTWELSLDVVTWWPYYSSTKLRTNGGYLIRAAGWPGEP